MEMVKRRETPRTKGPVYDPETGKQICGGVRRRDGGVCRRRPVPGSNRCKYHGGMSLRGPDHPNWKGGAYVEFLPKDMVGRFREALDDPHLRDLSGDIALNRSLLQDHLGSLHSDQSLQTLLKMRSLLSAQYKAERKRNEDPESYAEAKKQTWLTLEAGITRGSNESRVQSLQADRVRLIESVNRREEQLQQNIPIAEAFAFARAIGEIVNRLVTDRTVRSNIMREVSDLMQGTTPIGAGTPPVIDV